MSGFIAWLEKLNESDSKVRAVLRRSLAFDPGQHIPAFPYVEPFLKGEESGWPVPRTRGDEPQGGGAPVVDFFRSPHTRG